MNATPARRFWFHSVCTVGWAFLCPYALAVQDRLDHAEGLASLATLFGYLGLFAAPPVVLLRVLLQREARVRWWWRAGATAAGAAAVAAAAWAWVTAGHVRLENTRLLVGPGAFAVAWACAGVVIATTLTLGWAARSRAGLYVAGVAALAGGVFGLLRVVLPGVPAAGEEWAFLLAPVIVLEAAVCYGVLWAGARRAGGAQQLSQPGGSPQ